MAPPETISYVPPSAQDSQEFRQQIGHISRQSLVFFAGTIFTAAAGYLFKIYLARVLGAEALGLYTLGMTIAGFLGIFGALGLPQAAVRFVAAYRATGNFELLRGFLGRSILLLLISNLALGGVVLLAGSWFAVHFYHTQALNPYLLWFALLMLLGALTTFLGQVLAGFKDVALRTVITNFTGSPLMMIFTLGLVSLGWGLRGYMAAQVAGSTVVGLLLLAAVWKLTPHPARSLSGVMPPIQKQVMWFSAAVFAMNFLEFLLAQADKVLIGFYLDAAKVGIYAVAAAVAGFVPIVLQSVNQIFSPTVADLHARGERELLGRIFQTLTKWILGLTLPLAAAVIIFAPAIMRMFGRDFGVGWPVLVICTLGQLVNCGVGSVGYLLLMSGNQRRLIRIQAVMAAGMVVLNLLLIPRWGIIGAATAAAITNAASNLWYLRSVHRTLGLLPYNWSYVRLIAPVTATTVVLVMLQAGLRSLRPEWIVVGVGLALGYVTFVGGALAFGLDPDDKLIARAVWSRICGSFARMEVSPDARRHA